MLAPVAVMAVVALLHLQTGAALNLVNVTGGQQPPGNVQTMLTGGHNTQVADDVVDLITSSCIFPEDFLLLRRLAHVETRDGEAGNTYGIRDYYGGIWKVDQNMFLATQRNTPLLQDKYAAIRRAFGIDWMSVRWQDLQKPLYSGLAAALYLQLQGQVPADWEQQGSYVEHHYDAAMTANNFTRLARQLTMCTAADNQTIDVVFMLDATIPSADFTRIRDFVADVIRGLAGNIRIAVYQFDGQSNIQRNYGLDTYSLYSLQVPGALTGLSQYSGSFGTSPDIGSQLIKVMTDAWSGATQHPLAAKMVVLITERTARTDNTLATANQIAASQGISVLALGVGHQVSDSQLDRVATYPKCRHHLSVSDFQDIKFIEQLVQRTICREPVIARGMFHCRIQECRNVAFPITNTATTLITNVTCDDGNVYVTTRMPRPNTAFNDFNSVVEGATGPSYVSFIEDIGHFIYADFFPIGASDPNCIVTMTTVSGIIGPPPTCKEWTYPDVNPCLTATRQLEKFPYERDTGMFIQCDLQNQMYLTKCPPGYPYYSADCEVCLGGPNSPAIAGCKQTPVTDTPYCGRDSNPCTQENIQQDHLYFDCPVNETMYLQCNIWGHAFIRSCPDHEVWRQHDLACVYHNTDLNPCGSIPGERFYPYPPDPHSYIDCGDNNVPNVMHCWANLVWSQEAHTCDYPHGTTPRPLAHLTEVITASIQTTPHQLGPYGTDYASPCTLENVQANQLFHPYPDHPTQYLQCDLWGDTFVRDCQPGYSYNPPSHTCVDGPVHVVG